MTPSKTAIVAAIAILSTLGLGAALAQTTATPSAPEPTAVAPAPDPKVLDIIFSRMVVMDMIDLYMGEVEAFSASASRDNAEVAVEAAEAADIVSVLLLAFPHMFPPGSDIWSEELEAADPTTVTRALPNVWTDFEAFYALAKSASDYAVTMSRLSPRDQRFIDAAAELRTVCDTCHAEYTRPVKPNVLDIPGI